MSATFHPPATKHSMSSTQQDQPVTDSPPPQPAETPREKRIRTLTTRNASLEAQLSDLTGQRTSLLCELHTALHPSSTNSSTTSASAPETNPPPHSSTSHNCSTFQNPIPPTLPSTAGHSIPIPHNSHSSPTPPSSPQATVADAQTILKHHIHLLHTYNEIRDIGLGLMGLIAEQRGLRIKEVQEEFGIGGKD